jgi:hypothetical protein
MLFPIFSIQIFYTKWKPKFKPKFKPNFVEEVEVMLQTIGVFVALVLLLTACANVEDTTPHQSAMDPGSKKITKPYGIDKDPERLATPYNQYGNREILFDLNALRTPEQHVMSNMTFANKLSNAVSEIDGIGAAWIIVANKRAYVAAILDGSAGGVRSADPSARQGKLPPAGKTDRLFQDFTRKDLVVKPGMVATPMNTTRALGDVAKELKVVIAKKISSIDRSVEEVYVSSNRAFINQMNRYALMAWKGQSLQPYVKTFEKQVQHVLKLNPKEVTLSTQSEVIRQGTDGQSGGNG